MDAVPEEMPVERGKLRQRSSGKWYVQCRWCDEEARLEAPNEEEAYGMLHEWRLSMPRRKHRVKGARRTQRSVAGCIVQLPVRGCCDAEVLTVALDPLADLSDGGRLWIDLEQSACVAGFP